MPWTDEQRRNAAIIANVGRKLGATDRDIMIALSAAIVESGLRNLHYGDRDSVGLFQQRNAWGSFEARTDPAKAATMFFTGGAAGQRGLFDIKDRTNMTPGRAAQSVQVSAFPDRYDQHWKEAVSLFMGADAAKYAQSSNVSYAEPSRGVTLGTVPGLGDGGGAARIKNDPILPSYNTVDPLGGADGITAEDSGLGAIGGADGTTFEGVASGQLDALSFDNPNPQQPTQPPQGGGSGGGGGGGSYNGMADLQMDTLDDLLGGAADMAGTDAATFDNVRANGWRKGVVDFAQKMLGVPYVWGGTNPGGVDCSGLVQLAFKKYGINLPRISADQARSGQRIAIKDLQPGDLVAWDNSSRNNGADHIAIYIGNGQIIEAPRPGSRVQVNHIYGDAWGVRLDFPGGSVSPVRDREPSRSQSRPRSAAPAPQPAPRQPKKSSSSGGGGRANLFT